MWIHLISFSECIFPKMAEARQQSVIRGDTSAYYRRQLCSFAVFGESLVHRKHSNRHFAEFLSFRRPRHRLQKRQLILTFQTGCWMWSYLRNTQTFDFLHPHLLHPTRNVEFQCSQSNSSGLLYNTTFNTVDTWFDLTSPCFDWGIALDNGWLYFGVKPALRISIENWFSEREDINM